MLRANNFDALRLIGAMAVLFSHQSPVIGEREWSWMGTNAGTLGVILFFGISGYLVAGSWRSDPDLGRFLTRRFLRIFPGLAVAVLTTNLLVRALGLYGFPDNPIHALNPSLWTIEFEVMCYLLIAGAGLMLRHPVHWFVAGMVAAFALLPFSNLTWLGLYFAVGALLNLYPRLLNWRAVGLSVAAGALVFLSTGNTAILWALVVPPLAIWIGLQSWPVLRSAGRYGDLSYGIYIYACPIQQLVRAYYPQASYPVAVSITLALTVGVAWLSWRYVEAPMLLRKPSRGPAPGLVVVLDAGQVGAGGGSASGNHSVEPPAPPARTACAGE